MYRNAYQRGMLTIFFSCGSKPLNIWETHTQDGYITRFLDQDIKSMVLEIGGTNVSTTYMICPNGNRVLGITMPFLVMIVKNLKKYFSFEVTILDDTGTRRRFRVSNFQSTTQILPLCTVMPIGLSEGWNQIQFNLAEFTRRAYKKQFVEVQKLKINANIRLRRVYFTERLIPEDQLPPEYKLYFPLANNKTKDKKPATTPAAHKPSTSQDTVPGRVVSMADIKTRSKVSVHSVKKISLQTIVTEEQTKASIAEELAVEPDSIIEGAITSVIEGAITSVIEGAITTEEEAVEEDKSEAAPEAEVGAPTDEGEILAVVSVENADEEDIALAEETATFGEKTPISVEEIPILAEEAPTLTGTVE